MKLQFVVWYKKHYPSEQSGICQKFVLTFLCLMELRVYWTDIHINVTISSRSSNSYACHLYFTIKNWRSSIPTEYVSRIKRWCSTKRWTTHDRRNAEYKQYIRQINMSLILILNRSVYPLNKVNFGFDSTRHEVHEINCDYTTHRLPFERSLL